MELWNRQNKMTKTLLTVTLAIGAVVVIILGAVAIGVHYPPSESAEDLESLKAPITPPQGIALLYHMNYILTTYLVAQQ